MSDDSRLAGSATGGDQGSDPGSRRIVVITPDGMGVAHPEDASPTCVPGQADDPNHSGVSEDSAIPESSDGAAPDRERTNPADLVEEPAKVMRIGSMIKQLLEEVRNAPLDEPGRRRLAEIHHRSIVELKDGLAPELVRELDRIAQPFRDESPSDPELRIAQAQLVGWLEGLFHGIQTALVAQQMAAQQQLQQMRALPPGSGPGASYGQPPGLHPHDGPSGEAGPTGQYL